MKVIMIYPLGTMNVPTSIYQIFIVLIFITCCKFKHTIYVFISFWPPFRTVEELLKSTSFTSCFHFQSLPSFCPHYSKQCFEMHFKNAVQL